MFRHLFVCLSKQRSWKAVFIGPNRICPRWQAFRRGHLLNLVLYRRDRGRIRATELGSGGYDRRSCNPRHAGFHGRLSLSVRIEYALDGKPFEEDIFSTWCYTEGIAGEFVQQNWGLVDTIAARAIRGTLDSKRAMFEFMRNSIL